ncbi:hypothetical protein M0805_009438 [Coniferiporia weirii]|nr:hypothetical protein M0805_009438 [Coniferiporia weirii]
MIAASPPATAASGLSALFSLSNAAASVPPMPTSVHESGKALKDSKDLASGKNGSHVLKHRRLSSTGQTRRRMSDARDAVSRPNPANMSAASTLASLSSLSLSPSGIAASVSPTHTNLHSHSHHTRARSQTIVSKQGGGNGRKQDFQPASYYENPTFNGSFPIAISGRSPASAPVNIASSVPIISYTQDLAASANDDIEVDVEEDFDDGASVVESVTGRGANKKGGKGGRAKKRGTIFQCECCSKIYRHPSCLVKHRWEHSPHWREASKFLLSKHQQVQLLEAAAILSHLDPGTSLPEDRSMWPSYLSGGLLPPPSAANVSSTNPLVTTVSARSNSKSSTTDQIPSFMSHLVSSSVPVGVHAPRLDRHRSGSASTSGGGPRMHDYTVQGGITQVRPGLLAQPTAPAPAPARVLAGATVSPYADEDLDGKDESVEVVAPTHAAMTVTSPSKPQPVAVPTAHGGNGISDGGSNAYGTEFAYSGYGGYRETSAHTAGSMFSASGVSVDSLAHSGGWSLPRSDLRSSSVARSGSYSASRAGSRSDDEDDAPEGSEEEGDVDVDVADGEISRFEPEFTYVAPKYGFASRGPGAMREVVKEEVEDEWSMHMDMEVRH